MVFFKHCGFSLILLKHIVSYVIRYILTRLRCNNFLLTEEESQSEQPRPPSFNSKFEETQIEGENCMAENADFWKGLVTGALIGLVAASYGDLIRFFRSNSIGSLAFEANQASRQHSAADLNLRREASESAGLRSGGADTSS
jgi:hypothetical protein